MNLATLTWDLQRAEAQTTQGGRVVKVSAIVATTISSFVAFLLASGTWMFYQRYLHPEMLSPVMKTIGGDIDATIPWMFLSLMACVLLIPPVFSLTAQAAAVGASGRERSLAVLRLLGLTSSEVNRVVIYEVGLQAVLGTVLGLCLAVLSLPVFSGITFQDTPVGLDEIILPWWGYVGVFLIMVALSLLAALAGMRRVRVSPLGVAKREMPAALKWWRAIAFVVILVAVVISLITIDFSVADGAEIFIVAAMIALNLLMLSMFIPWLLQIAFRMLSVAPGTAFYVACRRISSDGRSAWKHCGASAFFGVIAGFLVISPFGNDGVTAMMEAEQDAGIFFGDIARGGLLTLLFGFGISAVSTFLAQATDAFESANLSRSLTRLGVSKSFHFRVAVSEFLGPVVLVSAVGLALGALIGFAMLNAPGDVDVVRRLLTSLGFLAAGWAMTLLALLVAAPVRNRVAESVARTND